jgi:hypothetical protein
LDAFQLEKLILSKFFLQTRSKEWTKRKDTIVSLKLNKNKMGIHKEKVDFIILNTNQPRLTLQIAIIQTTVK